MQRIGEFWIPDIDAAPGRNLERSLVGFSERQGIQIHHLHRALELAPGRRLVVDGGANVGAWTKTMAAEFDAVHSFEPNPDVYPCLKRNVEDWGIADKVTVYPNGLSDRSESVAIETSKTGRTATGRISGAGDIECVTIDSLDLPACSLLKLDVEGYEAQALNGARRTIEKFRPWILIENKRKKFLFFRLPTAAEKVLRDFGYELVEKIGDDDHQIDWLYKPSA